MQLPEFFERFDKLLEKYEDIPFGNSDVQNLCLLVAEEYSTGRQLRAYLLRLWNRKQALENAYFDLKKLVVELRRLKRKLEDEKDEFERELIEIEIQQKLNQLKYIRKLYKDALREVLVLAKAIESLPEIDREEFERQEFEHFLHRLTKQLEVPVQIRSLMALGYDLKNGVLQEDPGNKLQEVLSFVKEVNRVMSLVSVDPLLSLPPIEEEGGKRCI